MNIFSNYTKTAFLLAIMSSLLLLIGYFFGGDATILPMLLIVSAMNIGIYFFSDKVAIASAKAVKAQRTQHRELYAILDKLSVQMNIPTPDLYISPQTSPNAFATGRNPQNGVVCLTTGLMNELSTSEIEGVIAHEMSHIKNRDTLIATIAAVIASGISLIPRMAFWVGSGSRDRDSSDGISQIVLIFLAPIIAVMLQMAISRSREFSADQMAAQSMGSGVPLANALKKIANSAARGNNVHQDPVFASLYINPLKREGSRLMEIFSTHPPVERRIERLMNLEL